MHAHLLTHSLTHLGILGQKHSRTQPDRVRDQRLLRARRTFAHAPLRGRRAARRPAVTNGAAVALRIGHGRPGNWCETNYFCQCTLPPSLPVLRTHHRGRIFAVVLEQEEEEEAETPKATAKADVDPPGESGPDPEQQSSRAGSNKTGADQARMQEMLHALHARGTLDARDRVWLSALLKGGACAADLRRSDQDVLEYARHCLRSAMKRNGKRPAPATLEREVAAKFTLTSQHKTDIRQLLSQYTGTSSQATNNNI